MTDASGVATFSYVGTNPGTDTITATYLDANGSVAASDTAEKTWRQAKKQTSLTVDPATGDYNDAATVSATLTDSSSAPVVGTTVNFTMGAESCTGTTDASGVASCSITPSEAAGSYPLNASYAGDGTHLASSGSSTFTVTLEETTIHYTGPTVFVDGTSATLSGVLLEDGVTPIAGRTITLSLGSGKRATPSTGPRTTR